MANTSCPSSPALLLHYAPPSLPPPMFALSMHTPDRLQHPRPALDRLASAPAGVIHGAAVSTGSAGSTRERQS
jgi:hypothetical protein